jgi:hypothetical protein
MSNYDPVRLAHWRNVLPTTSVLFSLCASANRHSLNPWVYLTDVLTRMTCQPTDLTPLLPDAWAKQPR